VTITTARDPSRAPRAASAAIRLVPGLTLVAAITAAATLLGGFAPVIGAPVIAVVTGVLIRVLAKPSATIDPGVRFSSRTILQTSIVLLGALLSLSQVLHTGAGSLPVLLASLAGALAAGVLLQRALHLRAGQALLVGVGTAICGASAIAAVSAVVRPADEDVAYSISTIFAFNVAAVLAFPLLGHGFGLSGHAFGVWAGTAVNDTSSVVAAATSYGHDAIRTAVVVKLTRTLAIIPVCFALGAYAARGRSAGLAGVAAGAADEAPSGPAVAGGRRPPWRRMLPTFLVLFVVAAIANTLGLVPQGWHAFVSRAAEICITAALAAIGLSTRPASIRRAGVRPLLYGAGMWVVVASVSLGVLRLTGAF